MWVSFQQRKATVRANTTAVRGTAEREGGTEMKLIIKIVVIGILVGAAYYMGYESGVQERKVTEAIHSFESIIIDAPELEVAE